MLSASKLMGAYHAPVAPANDPYFANVSLLLAGGGVDASTTIVDITGKTMTNNGGTVKNSATQQQFGLNMIQFDGTSYLTGPTGTAFQFGTGAYTIEAWIYQTARGNPNDVLSFCAPSSGAGTILQINNSGFLCASTYLNQYMTSTTGAVPLNTLTHIVQCRDASGVNRLFVNGVQVYSISGDTTNCTDGVCGIGATSAGAGKLTGFLRDVRVTKGVARYTAAFTPPIGPFPHSA